MVATVAEKCTEEFLCVGICKRYLFYRAFRHESLEVRRAAHILSTA